MLTLPGGAVLLSAVVNAIRWVAGSSVASYSLESCSVRAARIVTNHQPRWRLLREICRWRYLTSRRQTAHRRGTCGGMTITGHFLVPLFFVRVKRLFASKQTLR